MIVEQPVGGKRKGYEIDTDREIAATTRKRQSSLRSCATCGKSGRPPQSLPEDAPWYCRRRCNPAYTIAKVEDEGDVEVVMVAGAAMEDRSRHKSTIQGEESEGPSRFQAEHRAASGGADNLPLRGSQGARTEALKVVSVPGGVGERSAGLPDAQQIEIETSDTELVEILS